ncbi:hypothetical protein JTB14_032320 [Gonioctena quinquepunctata]|nr:hypothetical protein JTB14_032320 [Gonioctena quinquepunctata]
MASNNYLANVPKLQGRENYEEWSFAIENFLILEEELSDETYVPEDEESLVVLENVRRSQRERKTKNFEDIVTYFTPVKLANYEENPVGETQIQWQKLLLDQTEISG